MCKPFNMAPTFFLPLNLKMIHNAFLYFIN